MSTIDAIEQAILVAVDKTLGAVIREKKSLGGGWTMEMLDRALQFAPGVYVAFVEGGKVSAARTIPGRFEVYSVTKGAVEAARRQGSPGTIGAYDIVERLLASLDGLQVAGVGTMAATGPKNLFREAMFDMGGTVYAITLELPDIPLPAALDDSALANFETFAVDYDLPPFASAETHQKWVTNPPDHATGAPDLQDNLQLNEE